MSSEFACYSLPFGGLGFLSHLLTYYTLSCLAFNLCPLYPRNKLKFKRRNAVLAFSALAAGVTAAALTAIRCRHHWQLAHLPTWQLFAALSNAIFSLHTARSVTDDSRQSEDGKFLAGLIAVALCISVHNSSNHSGG